MDYIEFESKYSVDPGLMIDFKKLVDKVPNIQRFLYVEGEDEYYVHPSTSEVDFARYRRPSHGLDNNRSEVTYKSKPEGAKNNIIRTEINWRVDETPAEAIREGLKKQGYVFNFSIFKACHVYNLEDVTLVFYTVYDTTIGASKEHHSFIEIEVSEELLKTIDESQAWAILEKWERVLAPLGIKPQNRLKRSLYEIFRR